MTKLKFLFLLLILGMFCVTTVPITAQENSVSGQASLSLQDCIQIALQNKADVRIARDQMRIAGAQRQAAWGAYLPSLSFSLRGSQTEQGVGRRFFSGIEFTAPASRREYYSSGLSLNQPLFTGGRLLNAKKYADLNYVQAQVGYEATREQVILDVTNAYFEVLRSREFVRVYEQTLESSEAQVELVQERYNLGAVAQSDVFKAQTRAGNDRINLLQQQNTLSLRKRNLNLVMGRDPSAAVVLPDFNYAPPEIPDMEQAKQQALQANRDLAQYQLDVQKSRANLAIARSNLLPSLNAFMGYDRTGFSMQDLYKDFDLNWSYSFGVQVSVPIFNNFQNRTRVDTRRLENSIARQRYQDARLAIEMQAENLIQQLETYREIIALNEINLNSAEEDLRLARERYNIGQATLLDVLDAQAALTNARRILVYTKFDAKTQEAQLEALLGELINKAQE